MSLNLPEPILVSGLFPEVLSELLSLLKSLSDEDWQQPTVCEGWSVKDVALHLLGVEVGNLSRRRDGHKTSQRINTWEELVAAINDSNQRWVEVGRRISNRLLLDLLELTGRQMGDYFASLDPYAMGPSVSWVGPKPAKVWVDIAREYTERWHHQQHIRDAVGKPDLKQPRYFAPVLQTYMLALPHTYQDALVADGTSLAVTITGAAGGSWSITSLGGDWRLYSGLPEFVEAHVFLNDDLAWRLFTRGIDRETAWGKMRFEGNQPLGLKLLDMVAIIA
jgi:uncharacterized protein (TIGR03083 family)